jgi:hypothetical protein
MLPAERAKATNNGKVRSNRAPERPLWVALTRSPGGIRMAGIGAERKLGCQVGSFRFAPIVLKN